MAQPIDPNIEVMFEDLPESEELNGPAVLDREAVARVSEMVSEGKLVFPSDMNQIVESFPQEKFDAVFRRHLDQVRLRSKLSSVGDKRALALATTLLEISKGTKAPLFGDTEIDATGLEMYLRLASDRLPERFTEEQRELLRDELWTLTPAEVALATGLSVNQLSQWRFTRRGPRYVKLTQSSGSIRYPAVALLLWAEESAR